MSRNKNSRNDPLLDAENGTSSHRGRSTNVTVHSLGSSTTEPSSSLIGCLGHSLLIALPLLAGGLILALLGLLIASFPPDINIQTTSISGALEDYQPYSEIVILSSMVAVLAFAVTAARNIQIAVSMK